MSELLIELKLYWLNNFLGHATVGNLLISHGANISAETENKDTPLHKAALGGNVKFFNLEMSGMGSFKQLNCVNYFLGNEDIVKVLIEHGANVNGMDNEENTPLHHAALNGMQKRNISTYVLKSEILHLGHAKVANILIAYGANVNAKDIDDDTPLHRAASYGNAFEFAKLKKKTLYNRVLEF